MSISAYQLCSAGAKARLSIFRALAIRSAQNANPNTRLQPGDWRGARSYTLKDYEAAYGLLSQSSDGSWYSHCAPDFRDERDSHDIVNIHHRGWWANVECDEKSIGIVCRLSHGRFIAGYRWDGNDERVYYPEVFTDEHEAARMGDEHARVFSELSMVSSEKYRDVALAELDVEEKTLELEKAIALRHRAKFGGFDRVRHDIGNLRNARETLARATREYEGD